MHAAITKYAHTKRIHCIMLHTRHVRVLDISNINFNLKFILRYEHVGQLRSLSGAENYILPYYYITSTYYTYVRMYNIICMSIYLVRYVYGGV